MIIGTVLLFWGKCRSGLTFRGGGWGSQVSEFSVLGFRVLGFWGFGFSVLEFKVLGLRCFGNWYCLGGSIFRSERSRAFWDSWCSGAKGCSRVSVRRFSEFGAT